MDLGWRSPCAYPILNPKVLSKFERWKGRGHKNFIQLSNIGSQRKLGFLYIFLHITVTSTTLNMLISVRWRLVLEPIVIQNTKCHLKVQLMFYEALIFYLQFFIWRSTKICHLTLNEVRVHQRFLAFLMLPPTHSWASPFFAAIRQLITCQSPRCYSFGMLVHWAGRGREGKRWRLLSPSDPALPPHLCNVCIMSRRYAQNFSSLTLFSFRPWTISSAWHKMNGRW